VVVPLPTQTIVTEYNTPHSGNGEWWGGSADDINVTLARDVNLVGATTAKVTTQAWYDIEEGYDFLYGEVSTDGGATWAKIGTEVDGISGGGEEPVWVELSYNLDAYAGQNVKFRFRYQTDGGVHYAGPFLDDIALVTNGTGWVDDVEAGTGAWTANGFTRMTGSTSRQAEHFYMAEFRSYTGYDKNLKTGPYNFTGASSVEKFPYQDGMLVWYVNYEFSDNNTIAHRGGGLALPVDARPAPITYSDGTIIGNRRQPFDATFGTQKTDAVTFHKANGATATVPASPAIRVFDDSDPNRYYSTGNPLGSVKVAGNGVKIKVVIENNVLIPFMVIQVTN
jgi:immune inhibitor A